MVILIILAYLIIGVLEIYPLIEQKKKKELIAYSLTFSIAFVMSLLLSLGVEIPSPVYPIENAVKAIMGQ
ncbi:hypothetical protein SAMN00017405_1804 [Desulfonispora thiosulfatigenes DSM 11270]|uniref:Uncharacterized protein n=1 Tax=Desulfonispora thiosulfatigenes DSM 11270 TaxID=656914 RepID=A0A1W1V3U7_DESTI|nr:hypothetical protein [Desulfonispora thiosulfatigenes]SMB87965.1 hypothetical protein SAMN00017405_1804 [Desulfonispora thiosulfatigenes DSM 11270]